MTESYLAGMKHHPVQADLILQKFIKPAVAVLAITQDVMTLQAEVLPDLMVSSCFGMNLNQADFSLLFIMIRKVK